MNDKRSPCYIRKNTLVKSQPLHLLKFQKPEILQNLS